MHSFDVLLGLVSVGAGAIAAVSIPHFIATTLRFCMLRAHIDKRVFFKFGITSVVGGLVGALLNARFTSPAITLVLSVLLLFTGMAGLTEFSQKMRFDGKFAWAAGFISGCFGGLAGNQGGIRSAAMMGFGITKESFIATSTAIGMAVDAARMPVYFAKEYRQLYLISFRIFICTAGVVAGTFLGVTFLRNISQERFRKIVSGVITVLGFYLFYEVVRN